MGAYALCFPGGFKDRAVDLLVFQVPHGICRSMYVTYMMNENFTMALQSNTGLLNTACVFPQADWIVVEIGSTTLLQYPLSLPVVSHLGSMAFSFRVYLLIRSQWTLILWNLWKVWSKFLTPVSLKAAMTLTRREMGCTFILIQCRKKSAVFIIHKHDHISNMCDFANSWADQQCGLCLSLCFALITCSSEDDLSV